MKLRSDTLFVQMRFVPLEVMEGLLMNDGISKPRVVVTVDGSAASGKTALARLLAERLGYMHLNSGLLYRSVAWFSLAENIPPENAEQLVACIRANPLSLQRGADGGCQVWVKGVECKADLNASEVSATASVVAQHPEVRLELLAAQRNAFLGSGVVAEGRDMGTVVFPDAISKFFVTARIEVRAQRRLEQLIARGESIPLSRVMQDLLDRDERDSKRAIAPMIQAKGGVLVDNSDRSLEDTVSSMIEIVEAGVKGVA